MFGTLTEKRFALADPATGKQSLSNEHLEEHGADEHNCCKQMQGNEDEMVHGADAGAARMWSL